jgi:putative ABC transport system permease protein
MQNKDLGFDKENIVVLDEMFSRLWLKFNREWTPQEMTIQLTRFKQELLKNPNVIDASYARSVQGSSRVGYDSYQVRVEGDSPEKISTINTTAIDYNYLNVFGLEMIAGRNFRKTSTFPETVEGIILNERAVKYLGFKNPVGKHIYIKNWQDLITNEEGELQWVKKETQFPIIGVFKDFHTHNLYSPIRPTMYMPLYKGSYMSGRMAVKFFPGNISKNISFLKKTWNEFGAIRPLKFSFFDQDLDTMYKKEKRLAQIFAFFSILAIFIACLGIFGLSVLTIANRTKEIGIRKVNGATSNEIMYMLNKEFVKRVIISFIIACPIVYYFIYKWLENFAYRTSLSWWVFALAGAMALIIVLLTVSWQSFKASIQNPVEALRDE